MAMTSATWLNYRPDPSRGPAWSMEHGRFLVIVTDANGSPDGTIFEGGNIRIAVSHTASRAEAEEIARTSESGAVVFAVRRDLSLPTRSWIAADPEFWAKPASEKDVRAVVEADQTPQ